MSIKENFLTKILAEGILHIFERELIVMGILIEGVPNEINIQLLLDLLKNKINKEVNIAYLTFSDKKKKNRFFVFLMLCYMFLYIMLYTKTY